MSGTGEIDGFSADDQDFGFRIGPERDTVPENFQRFDRCSVFMFAAVDFFRPAVMIPVSGFTSPGGKVRCRFFPERILAEPFETFGCEFSQNIPEPRFRLGIGIAEQPFAERHGISDRVFRIDCLDPEFKHRGRALEDGRIGNSRR